jgi:hypothetical protein
MQKLPFETVYLSDLLEAQFIAYCKAELIKVMQQIIVYDNSFKDLTAKEKIFLKDVSNPNYWASLNPSNRNKKKVKYDELVKNNSRRFLKDELIKIVKEKGDVLTNLYTNTKATILPLV